MKRIFLFTLFGLVLAQASAQEKSLVTSIDFTEYVGDVPNPDRGFYRPQTYVVPVLQEPTPVMTELKGPITGTNVFVDARIVYMAFDLKNFSSNAPLDHMPAGPWGTEIPNYGMTQPLTTAALDYIRVALQRVRESEAVAIVKFCYDEEGYTYNNRRGYDKFIHDCEPGAPEGRSWYETGVREDSDLCGIPGHEGKNWVQYHLWQLGSVFSEYEDVIMSVKAGFFGPWGEMHSSSYARSSEGYYWLLQALLDYVPSSRSILVHAGGVMAWHNMAYGTNYSFSNIMPAPARGVPAQRFGMFNDSYSRGGDGYTDGGSLSEGQALIGGEFDRNTTLTWIRDQQNFYGGETVSSGNESRSFYRLYPRFPNVPYEASYARTTHLNASYSAKAYRLWGDFVYSQQQITKPFTPSHDEKSRTAIFDPVYDGKNGMEFMRDRLGYRLVLREAKTNVVVDQDGHLSFEGKIQNVGFGHIVNRKKVSVILRSKDGASLYSALTDIDARNWLPDDNGNGKPDNFAAWRDLSFNVNINAFGTVKSGEYEVYLKINDPKEQSANKRSIRFANEGDIWNADLGANFIGVTEVQ